jgi:hypothetical protein
MFPIMMKIKEKMKDQEQCRQELWMAPKGICVSYLGLKERKPLLLRRI